MMEKKIHTIVFFSDDTWFSIHGEFSEKSVMEYIKS
jgi:hypothetical protein